MSIRVLPDTMLIFLTVNIYNLVSYTSGVPTLRGPIPHRVQNHHILRQERSNRFKFGAYVDGSCRYWLVLLPHPLWRYRCAMCTHISCSIRANNLPYTTRFAKMIGAKRPGKGTLTLHSGISVTDRIKFNKQNKSVLLYAHSEFQAI